MIFADGLIVLHITVGSLRAGFAHSVWLERVLNVDPCSRRTIGDRTAVIAGGFAWLCTVVSRLTSALRVFLCLTLLYHHQVNVPIALPAGSTLPHFVFLINKCMTWTGFTLYIRCGITIGSHIFPFRTFVAIAFHFSHLATFTVVSVWSFQYE